MCSAEERRGKGEGGREEGREEKRKEEEREKESRREGKELVILNYGWRKVCLFV